ncbi:MAG: hypothetical protein ACOVLD_02175, partial [Bacteroidia bacterium]
MGQTLQQSFKAIEDSAKNGYKLTVSKKEVEFTYYLNGKTHSKNLNGYFILLDEKLIYDLPGQHIPAEFIVNNAWERNSDLEIFFQQFAKHISKRTGVKMEFQCDTHCMLKSATGKVQKSLRINYGIAELLYN